jgi:hypothetical protein
MKKLITSLILCALTFASINAQEYEPRPEKNEKAGFESLFYQKKGNMSIHLSNFMFSSVKTISMPITIGTQVTAFKNFTIGPAFTYFKSKYSYDEAYNIQVWENSEEKFRSLMPAIKGEYHLTPLLDKMTRRKIKAMYIDLYVQSWIGYQFVLGESGTLEKPNYKDEYQDLRGGLGMGVRTMIMPFMGLFIEVGYSRVGYGSFGLSFCFK